MRGGTKRLPRNHWGTYTFQIHILGCEIFKSLLLFQEESHSITFLYIHLQIPHQQQNLSTNLTNPIYLLLLFYINPHMVLYKYPASLSPHHYLSLSDKSQSNLLRGNATFQTVLL